MRIDLRLGGESHAVVLGRTGDDGASRAELDGASRVVRVRDLREGQVLFTLDGVSVRAHVAIDGDDVLVRVAGQGALRFSTRRDDGARARGGDADADLAAAMTSQVVAVLVEVGQRVGRGDPLVVLEAMKMESRIKAPFDATVTAVRCAAGEVVDAGAPLVELDPIEDPAAS